MGLQIKICRMRELRFSSRSASCLLVFFPFVRESSRLNINLPDIRLREKWQKPNWNILLIFNIEGHWKETCHCHFMPGHMSQCKLVSFLLCQLQTNILQSGCCYQINNWSNIYRSTHFVPAHHKDLVPLDHLPNARPSVSISQPFLKGMSPKTSQKSPDAYYSSTLPLGNASKIEYLFNNTSDYDKQ